MVYKGISSENSGSLMVDVDFISPAAAADPIKSIPALCGASPR